jgi:four helix bundle protein
MIDKPRRNLDIWKKSINLVQKIYKITESFLKIENYELTNQIRRSVISVPANIVEG